jgi:gliding motility-associated-like protein
MNKPVAKFMVSDSFSTCPPLTVNFTNQSENYVTYQWYFGDTNTSNIVSPEHVYNSPGVYPAKIILMSNGGCSDTAVENITVLGPTGTLSYKQSQFCYPVTQKIAAVSKNATQFMWDYSDGITNTTSTDTTSHVYKMGFYLPKLILVDAGGCKVPVIGKDTLKVYGVESAASLSNYFLCDSGMVNFTDSSVTNDLIQSSKWSFGDNTIAYGPAVTHDYHATGNFYTKLVDITTHGCTDSLVLATPVKVTESPVININGQTSYCGPSTVTLQAAFARADTSSLVWVWKFGNGDSSLIQNPPAESYGDTGTYQVQVTATTIGGCTGMANSTVNIHPLPQINAGGDTTICKNNPVNLFATGAVSYTWGSVPSISCTQCSSPLVIPDSTTTYTVTGKNQYGCTANDSVVVTVTQPVKITVSNSDTLCNGDTKQLTAKGAERYQWSPATFLSDATAAQPTFSATKDTSITYSVVGYTGNHCFSDTAKVKVKVYPIPQMTIAQNKITASAGSTVQLSTVNSPDVTKWKWTPAMWLSNPDAPNPTAQPRESITYTVVAANDGACVTRAQVDVIVTCNGANIFVPNTFSPNGDGMNDVFYPRGTGLYDIKSFRIFNRWGQIVFERLNTGANNASDGWNGTIGGKAAPSDVYVYVIEVLCTNNTVIPVKGNVTLLR